MAVCGMCDLPESETKVYGLMKVISLVDDHTPLESAMKDASAYLTRKVSVESKNLPGF